MNDKRIDIMLESMVKMAKGDFNIDYKVSENNDQIDALGLGLSLLADQLKYTITSKEHLNQINTEKETLLKELHHRVKNNLQVISGLLGLQASLIKDEATSNVFKQSQLRINSMAMVHEMLYQNEILSQLNLKLYLKNLITNIIESVHGEKHEVEVLLEVDDLFLNVDTAIPLGLIVNEIITNSLKYGFGNSGKGTLHLSIQKKNTSYYTMKVGDNGIGLSEEISLTSNKTLGLKLIQQLTLQLGGEIKEVKRKNGTVYSIVFKEIKQSSY